MVYDFKNGDILFLHTMIFLCFPLTSCDQITTILQSKWHTCNKRSDYWTNLGYTPISSWLDGWTYHITHYSHYMILYK